MREGKRDEDEQKKKLSESNVKEGKDKTVELDEELDEMLSRKVRFVLR